MKRLTSYRHHLRHIAVVAALAVAATAMLASGAASSALANSSFNCENASESKAKTCEVINGKNEEMTEGEGNNYTKPKIFLTFYKFNGGSSYTEIYSKEFASSTAYHCYSSRFDGHESVFTELEKDNIAGTQREGCLA